MGIGFYEWNEKRLTLSTICIYRAFSRIDAIVESLMNELEKT